LQTIKQQFPHGSLKLPYGTTGNFVRLVSSTAGILPISVKTDTGETYIWDEFGDGVRFDKDFKMLEWETTQALDTIEFTVGFGLVIPPASTATVQMNVPQPIEVEGPTINGNNITNEQPVIEGGVYVNNAGVRQVLTDRMSQYAEKYGVKKVLEFGDGAAGVPFTVLTPLEVDSTYRYSSWAILTLGDASGSNGVTNTVQLSYDNYNHLVDPKVLKPDGSAIVNNALICPGVYYVNVAGARGITVTPVNTNGNPTIGVNLPGGEPAFKFF
jgi:hypothetical protein